MIALDRSGTSIKVALWSYEPSNGRYRLVLGAPSYATKEPAKLYGEVQAKMVEGSSLSLDDVRVVPLSDESVDALRRAMYTKGARPVSA